MSEFKYIFDMDGTLYDFDNLPGGTFTDSTFYFDLRQRICNLLSDLCGIDDTSALAEYERIKQKFDGEISIGFETEFGVDRYDFFNKTWVCEPDKYIKKDTELVQCLQPLIGRSALLTATPYAWAERVIDYLGIGEVFGRYVKTGEPNLRKPNPKVFQELADELGVETEKVVSIGDQNYSDILPAKSLGMTTVLIGPEIGDADYRADSVYDALEILKIEGMI